MMRLDTMIVLHHAKDVKRKRKTMDKDYKIAQQVEIGFRIAVWMGALLAIAKYLAR